MSCSSLPWNINWKASNFTILFSYHPLYQLLSYIQDEARYSNSSLEYHGSYVDILKDGGDCLSVRFPDYADSRKVSENINDMFSEYVY